MVSSSSIKTQDQTVRSVGSQPRMQELPFTVDSKLLRELGERLVGQPHIALAELVKNSYDADATEVRIRFSENRIDVIDNGHGMNFEEFENFWMRIGSTHKESQEFSRHLKRPMTGSKGIGRLAVQFLARRLEMRTISRKDAASELVAQVNWDEAIEAGDLTEARALWAKRKAETIFPEGKKNGTVISLSGLNQIWDKEKIKDLAREIWWLQPPFRPNPELTTDQQKAFHVVVEAVDEDITQEFEKQMTAFLEIWHARLLGRLTKSTGSKKDVARDVELVLEFSDRHRKKITYSIFDCKLNEANFEIRIYHLVQRQRFGLKVGEAREYLRNFGGVHVYDAGFHLPYYGRPDSDWLEIEIDHSHRLSKSKLLPEELQIPEGMNFLPTNQRLLGIVHVNTSKERMFVEKKELEKEGTYLKIQVTRDRLVDNKAFEDLRHIVRYALDFYAMQEAKRAFEEAEAARATEEAREKFYRVEEVLEQYREDIPRTVYSRIRTEAKEAIKASETEAEVMARRLGLLAPLATAGITSLALQHEANQQLNLLESIRNELDRITATGRQRGDQLERIKDQLLDWINRTKATRGLFSFVMDEENRERKERFKARTLIDESASHMGILLRGVDIDTSGIDKTLRLPRASVAEWGAILQNVFINATNAMLDSRVKRISVKSRTKGRMRTILIQDSGVGVDLSSADELFKPFTRRTKISPERRALGLGGTGLGLTIVRMTADAIGCRVSFVEPEKGFKTAFRISWSEQK